MTTLRDDSAPARWGANLEALRTLKRIEREGREATPEERDALKRFAGFGDSSFNSAFQSTANRDHVKPGVRFSGYDAWARRGDELRDLLTPEEYQSIRESRTTAFYTSPAVVDSMWTGVQDLGIGDLGRLKVLEPSAGSGRFIERQPAVLKAKSDWTAVEKDDLTARMLRHAFKDVAVRHSPLEETILPDDSYDLAISNPPFGAQGVHDPDYLRSGKGHLTRSLHNYFFAKALDKVRPGGVVAFVTSHYTLDSAKAEGVRKTLSEEADLIGAVRLPRGAFPDTQVVTDIVYLRKRLPGEEPGGQDWIQTDKVDLDGISKPVNRYFVNNPRQILGEQTTGRGMREANEYMVLPDPANPVEASIGRATSAALRGAPRITKRVEGPPKPVTMTMTRRKSIPKVSAEDKPLVASLGAVRDLARRQVDMEAGGSADADIEANRQTLQDAYVKHVDGHGALNTPRNYALMGDDEDRALLFSLETYNKASDCWGPADIMGVRTISARDALPMLGGANDALDYHMQTSGKLDFSAIGDLIGEDADTVRDSLSTSGRVYRMPDGDWTTSDKYLSGNVREKLEWAKRAAAADPAFQPNVEALQDVQPPWVGGEDIRVPLGSPWVPAEYVNQWVAEKLGINPHGSGGYRRNDGGDDQFFAYDPDFGRWRQRRQFPKDYRTQEANRAMGTPKVPAQKIIEKLLTGGSLQIGDKMTAEDVRFAQQRARDLQENWQEWLWSDPDRAATLEHTYNHTFNQYKPRTYHAKEFYPGMAAEWQRQLHPFQREGIQRIVSDGTTLLAHEVGFGKTATMVGSAMERQRLGLSEKPLFVIPKATHSQFQDQFMEQYPGARILAPEEGEFSTANRERFLSRIATNDWDAVILSTEQFQAIPLSPAREQSFVDSEIATLQSSLETLESDESQSQGRSEGTRSMSQKAVDTALAAQEKKLKDLLTTMGRADAIYFDQLGVDMLYVDEADRYKNLPFRTGMGGRSGIKGMPTTGADRSWDMYLKIRYLQGQNNPVVFATGTPISNSLAEAWTMQRYLNEPELQRQGLHHFDAWAKTFGNMDEAMEMDAAGRYKLTKRFRDFVNKPELARTFQEVADIRVISETPTIQARRPKLAGGERHIIISPRDPQLDAYTKLLHHRAENLPFPPQKGDDNMLKVLTDGRKASMDLRLVEDDEGYADLFGVNVGNDARPYPEGKLVQVARNVARIHESEEPVKGVQLVFLDMGTPKAAKSDDEGNKKTKQAEAELVAAEAAVETGLYRQLRERMLDQGVPADQIAFIHDYPTADDREDLFDSVKKGDIRVLLGSTEKMGVGVNVQDRAAALHHVDAPWRPRDIEQREGRVLRQGNLAYGPILDADKNPLDPGRGVQVYQYVQKGGLDEFMWQSLEEKGRGIKGIMKRHIDPGERVVQEIDSLVLTAADTKAAAAANPLVKRNVELGHKIRDLQSDRKAHQLRVKTAQQEIGALQSSIENARRRLPNMERDAAFVQRMPKDQDFEASIGRRTFDKSTEAGEALTDAILKLPMDVGSDAPLRPLGRFKGFTIDGVRLESGYTVAVTRPETREPYEMHFGSKEDINPEGIMRRLSNQVAGISERAEQARERLASQERRLTTAEQESSARWDLAADLQGLQAEQEVVEARLKAGDTGEEENVVYGLQPLPVQPWTNPQVAAVERQLSKTPTPAATPATSPAAVVAEPPAPPRLASPPEEPQPVSAAPEPVPEPTTPSPTDLRAAQLAAITDDDLRSDLVFTQGRIKEVAGQKNTKTAMRQYAKTIEEYEWEMARRLQPEAPTAPPVPAPAPEPAPTPAEPLPSASPQPVQATPEFSRENPDIRSALEAVKQDPAYRNAIANSDEQNARIEHGRALDLAMFALMQKDPQTNAALYNAYTELESFKDTIREHSFKESYKAPIVTYWEQSLATGPPMKAEDLRENLKRLRGIDASKFPPGEQARLVGTWEQALAAAQDAPPTPAAVVIPSRPTDPADYQAHLRQLRALSGAEGSIPLEDEIAHYTKEVNEQRRAQREAHRQAVADMKVDAKAKADQALQEWKAKQQEAEPQPPVEEAAPSEKTERPRDARRVRREAMRKAVEDLGGAPPDGASLKELTALRDRLKTPAEPAPDPEAAARLAEARDLASSMGDALKEDVTEVTPDALEDLRRMAADKAERRQDADRKETAKKAEQERLKARAPANEAKYGPIVQWAEDVWAGGDDVAATVQVYAGMGGMAPQTRVLPPPSADRPDPPLRLGGLDKHLQVLEGYTKGKPRYVTVTDDYQMAGSGQSFKVGAGRPAMPPAEKPTPKQLKEPTAAVADKPAPKLKKEPAKAAAKPTPKITRAPATASTSSPTLAKLNAELSEQEEQLQKAEKSKGSKDGLPKFVRVGLAEKAVERVQRQIRAEEKRIATASPARRVAPAHASAPKGKTKTAIRKKPHPAQVIRNDARRASLKKSRR